MPPSWIPLITSDGRSIRVNGSRLAYRVLIDATTDTYRLSFLDTAVPALAVRFPT